MIQEELIGNKLVTEYYKECIYAIDERCGLYRCEAIGKWKAPRSQEVNILFNNFPIADGSLGYLINLESLKFNTSMDWLYPVYQKVCKYMDSEEFRVLNSTKLQDSLYNKYYKIRNYFLDGKDVPEVFKEIVEWVKIYNENVLI